MTVATQPEHDGDQPTVSIVIPTFNRREAVVPTVEALFRMDYPPARVEVIVVIDGSDDGSAEALAVLQAPFPLQVLVQENRGVSAARNRGAAAARGDLLVFLSDDLLVPPDFLREHVRAHRAVPGAWVVGGFTQLPASRSTRFGRFVDGLEEGFHSARLTEEVAPGIRGYSITARNLSLPRTEFLEVGGFDPRFRTTCEDQDLYHKVEGRGIRVVYNERIEALHNEQATTLERYGRFQRKGARDTVRFIARYPHIHGGAPVARRNGPIDLRADGWTGAVTKALKWVLSRPAPLAVLTRLGTALEHAPLPDAVCFRYFRVVVGLHMYLGWEEGLADLRSEATTP